ncbi:MAG: hypothetical protein R8G66_03210 [Cytophagales bacterium]|nr:hypothetical protein [Cytophagales bacterium]
MRALNQEEAELLEELVESALMKSADAMEKMLKIRIKSNLLDFGLGRLRSISGFDELGRFKVHLVKVQLKGEVGGAFYFVINAHEVDLINQVCVPEGMRVSGTVSENKLMKHGFMSEIENMIAALSIGEISEFLGVQLLSEVPEVMILQGDEVNEFLLNENFNTKTAFYVKSELTGVVVNISPFFLWMLDDSFLQKLRLNIVTGD